MFAFLIIIVHVFSQRFLFRFFVFVFFFDTTDSTANGMENVRENDEKTEKKKKVKEWTKYVHDTLSLLEGLVACHALYVYPILTLFCG